MVTVKKEEFITDLEGLVAGTLGVPEFQKKYVLGPDAVWVEGLTDQSTSGLVGNLGHLVAADDPRDSEEFKTMQKAELKKLIQLLRNGAPLSELDKIHFLADSNMKPPGILMKAFVLVFLACVVGAVILILKLLY